MLLCVCLCVCLCVYSSRLLLWLLRLLRLNSKDSLKPTGWRWNGPSWVWSSSSFYHWWWQDASSGSISCQKFCQVRPNADGNRCPTTLHDVVSLQRKRCDMLLLSGEDCLEAELIVRHWCFFFQWTGVFSNFFRPHLFRLTNVKRAVAYWDMTALKMTLTAKKKINFDPFTTYHIV